MNITVHIPTPLRRYTSGAERVACSATTLPELLAELGSRFPELRPHLEDNAGRLRPFLNVYVNEEDIRFLGGNNYRFQEDDEVMLVPAIAGGGAPVASVVVPATSANLGCAFDCAALALNRYLRVRVLPGSRTGFTVSYRGPHRERVPEDESNLVVKGIKRVAQWAGVEPANWQVEIENETPVAAGLGTSAAAIVAGILLGARLYGLTLDAATVLRLGTELEGHPDNVAAAYCGGLVLAASTENPGEVLTLKTAVPTDLNLVVVVPEVAVPTQQARSILPERYSREDAVHNLQRAAMLVATCFSGRYDLLPEFFRDRFHQPYRSRLVPGVAECLALRHPGLLGVFLSGSGASVLALARDGEEEIAGQLAGEFSRHGVRSQTLFLQAENCGARVFPAEDESADVRQPDDSSEAAQNPGRNIG